MQRLVKVLILDPETPGGLRLSMAWRLFSRSATADDMVLDFGSAQLIGRQPLKNCNTIESQQQTSGPSDGVTLNTMFTSASIARGRRHDSLE